MSEVLLEFIEPYAADSRTPEDLGRVVAVAVIAWNAACAAGSAREELLREMEPAFPPEARQGIRGIIQAMIRRKEQLYPNDQRIVVSYEVSMTPHGPHLAVMSAIPAP
jgi:hypothetical protein